MIESVALGICHTCHRADWPRSEDYPHGASFGITLPAYWDSASTRAPAPGSAPDLNGLRNVAAWPSWWPSRWASTGCGWTPSCPVSSRPTCGRATARNPDGSIDQMGKAAVETPMARMTALRRVRRRRTAQWSRHLKGNQCETRVFYDTPSTPGEARKVHRSVAREQGSGLPGSSSNGSTI